MIVLAALAGLATPAAPLFAAIDPSLQERLDRIERKLESRSLLDMLNQLQALQQDLRQMRGDLELQGHTLEEMRRRQRELYLDMDRRLLALESGSSGPATGTAPDAAGTTAPVPAPVPAGAAPAPTAESAGEQAAYEKALEILREGRYPEAAQAFSAFVSTYPAGSYADNAHYWLGETYYVTRDFERALSVFKKLVATYPQSTKIPDARLKIGFIHYEQKQWALARQELTELADQYPETTAARLARERLERMKKEGR